MKLLFLIKSLAPQGGGAERILTSLTGKMAQAGHDVTIATFDAPEAESFYALDPGVKWLKLAVGSVTNSASPIEMLRRVRVARKIFRKERPDVAIGFMHSAYVPLGWAMAGTRIPVVASEHIGFHYYQDRKLDRLFLRLSKPFLAVTTVISEAIRQSFPKPLRKRTEVIPNPVDAPVTVRQANAPAPAARKVIVTVGRLEEQKDHKTLVAAFARIASAFPDWDLRIVGEGKLRADLERQVTTCGMENRILLPGSTKKIGEEYARAELFVIASLFESFGLVTAEALAAGIPAIGFADCPGTNELILDGVNGLLVEGQDRIAALADAMAGLMGDAERRQTLGAAGPASMARYSLDSIVAQWLTLLRSVAEHPAA